MAKRVPPLSAATLTKIKPDPVKVLELVDGAVPGLRVRITPAGTRSWSLNIRAQGKMRRFYVGQGLSLSEARLKAEDLRRRIKEGADPTAKKNQTSPQPPSVTRHWNLWCNGRNIFQDGPRCRLIHKRRSATPHPISLCCTSQSLGSRSEVIRTTAVYRQSWSKSIGGARGRLSDTYIALGQKTRFGCWGFQS